jgi:hypothetical protein
MASTQTSEIVSSELRCNACWQVANAPDKRSFRTRCSHLFCEPCARRFFSKKLVCPVCDAPAEGDAGILALPHEHSMEVMTAVRGRRETTARVAVIASQPQPAFRRGSDRDYQQ